MSKHRYAVKTLPKILRPHFLSLSPETAIIALGPCRQPRNCTMLSECFKPCSHYQQLFSAVSRPIKDEIHSRLIKYGNLYPLTEYEVDAYVYTAQHHHFWFTNLTGIPANIASIISVTTIVLGFDTSNITENYDRALAPI
jgi:hypothetical protein